MNAMREVRIEKITLNIGAGKSPERLEKGVKLLHAITGAPPVKTFTSKRIPNWGLRPGLPIGCKLTLRKQRAVELLQKLLAAKDNRLSTKQFDAEGNVAFGIHEYIDIPGVSYDPEVGIMGLEVCITLERPGFRIKRRKIAKRKLKAHKITREEAISFMKKTYNVEVGGQE